MIFFFCSETDAYRTLITERGTAIHYLTGLLNICEPELTFLHILFYTVQKYVLFHLHGCTMHILEAHLLLNFYTLQRLTGG